MEELLQELADAELGKQVMDTVGVAVTKCRTFFIKTTQGCDSVRNSECKQKQFTRSLHKTPILSELYGVSQRQKILFFF